jgi:hypothetical protein
MISTHGLRHSTSELYQAHGGTRDDLRRLQILSSARLTGSRFGGTRIIQWIICELRILVGHIEPLWLARNIGEREREREIRTLVGLSP